MENGVLFSLKNRKIELGYKRLMHPRRAFLVIIAEFRRLRHHEYKEDKQCYERNIDSEPPWKIDLFHNLCNYPCRDCILCVDISVMSVLLNEISTWWYIIAHKH